MSKNKPTVRVDKPSSMQEFLTIRIDVDTKDELEAVARMNDRTLAAEIRRAIRLYLEGK